MNLLARVVLHELRERPRTTSEIAASSALSEAEVLVQLRDLNERVRMLLGYENDPITATPGGSWKADGIAGLLRLNSRVELEVVPKFLEPSSASWRSDFFLLAVLVRTGHLLVHDEISGDVQERDDLATLIARALLAVHAENERRPIRGYRRVRRAEFAIDGDVEWETLTLPGADGFEVSVLELTRRNPYNATMAAAVHILIPEVADGDTQAQLQALARHLSPQAAPPAIYPPLPPRHSGWQRTYDLARLIVEGLGLNLNGGTFSGPGFVLSTWSAWQALCEEVVRRALPDHKVVGQKQWTLGHRGSEPVYATPDISPLVGPLAPLLLDAKYKTRVGRKPRISASDLYESLAFLNAASAPSMNLLYPSLLKPTDQPLGQWAMFDKVDVGSLTVEGHEVQVQGISQRGGFRPTCDRRALGAAPKAGLAIRESPELLPPGGRVSSDNWQILISILGLIVNGAGLSFVAIQGQSRPSPGQYCSISTTSRTGATETTGNPRLCYFNDGYASSL